MLKKQTNTTVLIGVYLESRKSKNNARIAAALFWFIHDKLWMEYVVFLYYEL